MIPFISNSKPTKPKAPKLWVRHYSSSYPRGWAERALSEDFWGTGNCHFLDLKSGYMDLLSLLKFIELWIYDLRTFPYVFYTSFFKNLNEKVFYLKLPPGTENVK